MCFLIKNCDFLIKNGGSFHSYVLNQTRNFCHPKCLDNAAQAAGTKSFSPRSLPHDTNGPFLDARKTVGFFHEKMV